MADGFPKTGDTVYWADGKRTALNLEGVDLFGPFPNTDPEFFKIFGENWATKPDEFAGVRGVRQSLIVDAETIGNGVSRVMEEMSKQPGGGEWQLPSFAQHTDLLRHVIAATKFDLGWAGSAERRKYLPGSVATDPQPRPQPPTPSAEVEDLKRRLADVTAAREQLAEQVAKQEGKIEELETRLAAKPPGDVEELRKKVATEIGKARATLGKKAAGKWWQSYRSTVEAIAKLVTVLLLVLGMSGCAAWRAIVPGGVSAADAEWSGVKSGPTISIVGSLDPRASAVAALLPLLGAQDPLGVFMPVLRVGETQPVFILCQERKFAAKCNAIPLNARIAFAGRPIGPGGVWLPSRLTATDFND